jgi:hypothetical protein
MTEQKVRAILIIEVAGRPAEHLSQAIKDHVGKMKSFKGIDYLSETFSEPRLIDQEKDIYTCFAEVEIEVESLFRLTEIVFDFFPSSVEVIEPDNLKFNAQEATMFLNDLAGRLHKYDEIAKVAQMKNNQLIQHLQKIQQAVAEHKMKKDQEEKLAKPKKIAKKKSKKK